MTFEHLRYETDGPIVRITIDRPDARNALLDSMQKGLDELMLRFDRDPSLIVAILTGAGTEAFCAGGDLKVMVPAAARDGLATVLPDPTQRFFSTVTKPIICAVNGPALAGGMEVVMGTDLRIAADHATFGLPEVQWGLVAAAGSHTRLPRQIPWVRAMELLLLGESISASDALAYGLVNRVVPVEDLADAATRMAERICANGPLAVRAAKAAVVATHTLPWEEAFRSEFELGAEVFRSRDGQEGPRAFVERRAPRFTGT